MFNKTLKRNKGITLIALVVTIIVLLILAGISIMMLTGQNGILNRANQAKENTGMAQTEELVKLSVTDALTQGLGSLTDENLKTSLNNNVGTGKYEITGDTTNGWTITVNGKEFKVDATGNIDGENGDTINWNTILADANANPSKYRHSEQSSTNKDIGIGTDGKPVNMDLWTYEIIDGKKEIRLGIMSTFSVYSPGYKNENIVDGKIIGAVPEYIKIDGKDEFVSVTSMGGAFFGCKNLTTAPIIPSSVTDMGGTFHWCENLTTAPIIPSSVTNMTRTFFGCTNLTTAPTIPSSVTNMEDTFIGCTNLTTAPTIPSSVTNMGSTFSGCTNLTTAPTIPSSVTNMWGTFSGCTNLTTAPTIPSSVTSMSSTFRGCTNLTTAPTIPSSVTDMSWTFERCTNLQGIIEINATPTSYSDCFADAATQGTGLTVTGSSSNLDAIIATKSSDSKIQKGN